MENRSNNKQGFIIFLLVLNSILLVVVLVALQAANNEMNDRQRAVEGELSNMSVHMNTYKEDIIRTIKAYN